MNRGDHGNSRAQFSCAVDWIQDKTSDVHNVPVACELLVHFVYVLVLLWLSLRNSQDMQRKRVCVCVCVYLHIRCDRDAVAAQPHYPKKEEVNEYMF